MLSGLSHDPLQRDIFTPLWLGATISIPDPEIIGTPKLARWMAEERITFAHLTPAMAEMLTETAAPGRRITSLRYAFFVGDKLTRRDVARLRRLAPEAVCIASYGSTETQRAVGYHMVSPAPELSESGEQSAYPLGRGVDDAQILVLTKELQLAGVGELGEIYLRSPHLAEGYLGDEELTRARFLTNPFTGVDGDRLYRTGDMGRFLPDGAVEFVGRIDDQVKIRGFRVEPGEIAAALCQHAAVREAVVVAREDPSTSLRAGAENPKSEKRLVAYVVPHSEQAIITADEVRSFLTAKLPAYMAPSAFVFLDALPRTPNGKIDRRALPPPDRAKVDGRPGYAAPTPGTIEPQLAEIWEELLGIHPIGTQDNFFDLGGHSLLAVQMAHRIEQICGERLPLAALLAGPTIQHLVRALLRQRNEGQRSLLVKVQPRGAKLPFFFLHGDIQGGGFYCLNLAKCLGEDQPFYALAPHGLNGSAVLETVEAMAASYIEMIRAVQPEGPYFLGGMCKGGIVAFEMARQLERQGQRVGLVVIVAAGARNTLPRRLLNGMVSRAGSWLGLQPRQRLRLFLGIRAWGHRVRRIFQANHYRVDQAVTSAQTSRDPAVARLHNRALGGYLSKPYSGRVALLWPAEEPFDRRRNPTFGWGRVTSQLEIRIVPGGHITCVTEHLETLAGHMKGLLEQAQR
jgi:thioesterase domain-containing protein